MPETTESWITDQDGHIIGKDTTGASARICPPRRRNFDHDSPGSSHTGNPLGSPCYQDHGRH